MFYFDEISILIPRTNTLGTYFEIAGDTYLKALLFQILREGKPEF